MIEIRPGVVRDVSFVAANMRPKDRAEIMCQFGAPPSAGQLAHGLVMASTSWTAWYRGRPVLALGVHEQNAVALQVWAFGTKDMERAVPAVTDFVACEQVPLWIENGYRIMEARSLIDHHDAHRWMLGTGAQLQGDQFPYGVNGEVFFLFRWTVPEYRAIRARKSRWQRYRRDDSVLLQIAETPKSPHRDTATEEG